MESTPHPARGAEMVGQVDGSGKPAGLIRRHAAPAGEDSLDDRGRPLQSWADGKG
jgi:hypothetical protein